MHNDVFTQRNNAFKYAQLHIHMYALLYAHTWRGGGLGSSTIFKKFNETYAPS